MRIHDHVSIILLIAIVGAISLAVTVGAMTSGIERSARAAGISAEQYSQVESVVANGRDLRLTVKSLTSGSSQDVFSALGRDLQRSIVTLARLRYSVLVTDKAPVEHAMIALETIARQELQMKQRGAEGVLTAAGSLPAAA